MPATYESIATTTLSSAASSITFSSISSAYTDLRLVFVGQSDGASVRDMRLRFNSDTGTNYSDTFLYGDGASATSTFDSSVTSIRIGYAAVTTSSYIGTTQIDIFSYAGSTNKTLLANTNADANGSGYVARTAGLWRSTSAITAVQIFPSAGNFNTGAVATLYGILKA